MKYIKKIAGVWLAVVMVLAMTVTGFATETTGTTGNGSITVDNPQTGQTYTAYKIFDVVYNADKTAYSYTISSTSEWFNVVTETDNNGNVSSKIDGLTFQKNYGENTNTYTVIQGGGFSASSFANTLKAETTGKTGTTLSPESETGKVSATGLALGYYFVTSTSGALCNLTTTNPTVTIHDKNDVPFDKVDDKVSADVGETVHYTITGKVPNTTGFQTYDYIISDTMSNGLTFQKDVVVKVGTGTSATILTKDKDYTIVYDVNSNSNSFNVTIKVKDLQQHVGKEIAVTYSAVVNENAVAKIEKNRATLTYSNDPTDTSKTTTTPPDEETVYSSKIVIDKYDSKDEENKLAGATFYLYKEVTTGEGDSTTSKRYYKYTAATDTAAATVEWVPDKNNATSKTTDNLGAANFDGLANGTYYLEETAAPAGYNRLDAPVTVTIAGGTTEAQLTVTAEVENNTGSLLPSTGGIGTTIFYVLGGVLVVVAGVLLIAKRRMNAKK